MLELLQVHFPLSPVAVWGHSWTMWTYFWTFWLDPLPALWTILFNKSYVDSNMEWTFDKPPSPCHVHMVYECLLSMLKIGWHQIKHNKVLHLKMGWLIDFTKTFCFFTLNGKKVEFSPISCKKTPFFTRNGHF